MIYPRAFLDTLEPEEVAMLVKPRLLGLIPWSVTPSGAGALDNRGLPLNNGGATGITITTGQPDGSASGINSMLRHRILSGTGAGNTAGLFGIGTPAPSRHRCAAVGWVAHWICGGAISVVGRAGHFEGETFAADSSFDPDRAVGASGYVKVRDQAAIWRWYNGVPGVTEPLTEVPTAPADARYYARALAVPAQAPGGTVIGRALMIDLSDFSAPVLVDRRTFVVPTPAQPKGPEWNHSPENAGSGGTQLEMCLLLAEGSYIVRELR